MTTLSKALLAEGGDISFLETNVCRYADSQELRFSLRSIAKNAPWIRNIFIVTNGQIPEWLDTSHPKIHMVFHSEIMPPDALPTFNAVAIEACLANISGLSERFLYSNDDFFMGRPLTPSFFFTDEGLPIVYGVPRDWARKSVKTSKYITMMRYSMELIRDRFGHAHQFEASHNMIGYSKRILRAVREEFAPQFEETLRRKFSEAMSVQRIIADYYALSCCGSPFVECDFLGKGGIAYLPLASMDEMRETLNSIRPALFCINDNNGTLESDRIALPLFLQELFPEKAEWEKDDINMEERRALLPSDHQESSLLALVKAKFAYMYTRALCSIMKRVSDNVDERLIHIRAQRRRILKDIEWRRRRRS